METADRTLRLQATPPGVVPSGIVVSLSGRRLTGPDPERSCIARLPADPEPQTLVLVFSPLLGYGIPTLLERLPHGCAVLMVEFEQVLIPLVDRPENVVRRLEGTELRYACTIAEAHREIDALVRRFAIRRVVPVFLTGGARFQAEAYHKLTSAAEHMIQRFWSNRGTQIRLARRWIGNLMRNAPLAAAPLEKLAGSMPKTVLLVGAGPNLDNHLDWIGSLKNRITVVALDTALPVLAEAGIQPDYLVSMDSQVVNAYDMLPWRWDEVKLVADLTVHPSIPRRFPARRRSFFTSRFAHLALFHEPALREIFTGTPVLPPRGSVAPAAIEVLVQILGIRAIVTVGVDFWYRSPRSHALMTAPDRRFRATMNRLYRNDGYLELLARPCVPSQLRNGEPVTADAILDDHARQMQQLLVELGTAFPPLRVCTVDPIGLETGASVVSVDDARELLLGAAASAEAAAAAEAAASAEAVPAAEAAAVEQRVNALHDLLERLRSQEEVLTVRNVRGKDRNDSSVHLDSGLEFVLLDFPQWPLMTVRQEWIRLHRDRVLDSTRDYRRRLERALLANATPRVSP